MISKNGRLTNATEGAYFFNTPGNTSEKNPNDAKKLILDNIKIITKSNIQSFNI